MMLKWKCLDEQEIVMKERLTNDAAAFIIKAPGSWGVSGTLYQQSAIAGVIFCPGSFIVRQPLVSGVDVRVLRNRNLRTVSGQEWSSTKQELLCAARAPGPS